MNQLLLSSQVREWLGGLRDLRGKAVILSRIRAAEHGNFGDCAPVGHGVSEMRIHSGPGYRLYFTRQDRLVYFVLVAGSKGRRSATSGTRLNWLNVWKGKTDDGVHRL